MKKNNPLALSPQQTIIAEIIQRRLKKKNVLEAFFSNQYFIEKYKIATMGTQIRPFSISRCLNALEKKGYIKVTFEKPALKHGGLDRRIKLIMPTHNCN